MNRGEEIWHGIHESHKQRQRITIVAQDVELTGQITTITNTTIVVGGLFTVQISEIEDLRMVPPSTDPLIADGWRHGADGLWRNDRFGGSYSATNALRRIGSEKGEVTDSLLGSPE